MIVTSASRSSRAAAASAPVTVVGPPNSPCSASHVPKASASPNSSRLPPRSARVLTKARTASTAGVIVRVLRDEGFIADAEVTRKSVDLKKYVIRV